MITQSQIESKDFTYWRTSEKSPSNKRPNRDDYLAIGIKHEGKKNEVKKVLLLSYDSNGGMTVTDYYNNPIRFREYYVSYTQVDTTDELDEIIEKTGFTISVIDLDKLTTNYE